ncbi:helix-turn-helix transcriptional regulator [Corallococcus exiguus]|uniref:ArsR/SmtB family transcription factor n=1 Tax=Corallococcus TaxID=83461 RepID=UPI000EA232FD|nr:MULTISPECIES: helix-turn-helix transcriptional regulator [Corallococcus]NNC21259.1 helix-turn-helix transcriptional regulator [Corallococcus exiguus]NRD65929.1 helix-turn-helix transcriptional regulator [Corallococcus exiguus]RKH19037.1 transcriptional regulator [Corallococcus sp. CA041A]
MDRTMNAGPDLTTLATAVGDATRIRMLELLMEGRALIAKELAFGTGVSPATATAHLQRLEQARLVRATRQGRNKVFRIATPTVARMVEALMTVAVRGPRASVTPEPLRAARYCYDHLAGRLGMGITDALLRAGHLALRKRAFALTPSGEAWFQDFGIDLAPVREQRRHFAHRCLDWSERRDHLAGALGAALAARVFSLGWVERQPDSRGLIVTPGGQRGIKRHFGAL